MDSDLPLLVALVRRQRHMPIVPEPLLARLRSDASRAIARVLLGLETGNETAQAKAQAIRRLA